MAAQQAGLKTQACQRNLSETANRAETLQSQDATNFFLLGPILFSYYEESLVSSNLNSKLLQFHSVKPNLHANLFAHLRKSKRNNHQVGRKRENVKLSKRGIFETCTYIILSYICKLIKIFIMNCVLSTCTKNYLNTYIRLQKVYKQF